MVLDDCDSPLGRAGGLAVYPLATLWLLVGIGPAQGHLPHALGGDAQPRGGAARADAVRRAPRGADADGEPIA